MITESYVRIVTNYCVVLFTGNIYLLFGINSGNVYYEIVEGRNYIIKNRFGLYTKFRFISFYNSGGDKGYPTFQYLFL